MPENPELEALQTAIKTEEDSLELYRELQKKANLQMAKDTFNSLAAQEFDHIKSIKEFYNKLKSEVAMKDIEYLIKEKESERKELASVFMDALDGLKDKVIASSDDIEAFKLALDFELKAMSFYDERRKATKNEIAKIFYDFLYDMEYEHHKLLDSAILYLEDPGNWFQIHEKCVVEGG